MVCVLISFYKFFLSFSNGKRIFRGWGRVLIRFRVAASRVPRREDVFQRYYENSAGLLEKLRNIFKYLDLQCLDMFHSNATYVKGLREKYQKLKKNISKQRESFTKMQSYLYCILCSSQKCLSLKEV